MDFYTIIMTIIIYVVLFYLIEIITIKKDSPFSLRVKYAIGFFLLNLLVNILFVVSSNPPPLSVTIFQISFLVILSSSYIIWHHIKNKK